MDTKLVTIDKKLYSLGIPAEETADIMAGRADLHKSWMQAPYLCCQADGQKMTLLDSEKKTNLGLLDMENNTFALSPEGQSFQVGYRPVLLPLKKFGGFDPALEDRTDVPFAQGGCLCQGQEPVHLSKLPAAFQPDMLICDTRNMGSCLLWVLHDGLLLCNYILFTGTVSDILPFVCKEVRIL